MKRLSSTRKLISAVHSALVGNSTLADSVGYLLEHKSDLAKYASVEDFAIADDVADGAIRRGCEYHLRMIRAQLARELWSRQLFIGVTVLDDLLFYAVAHHPTTNPVGRVFELIRDLGLHHPGLVLFPVHSFGVLGAGLLHHFTDSRIEYTSRSFGLALIPQTNSLEKTEQFLDRATFALGVKKRVPKSLVEHWYRSRSTQWIIRNPLLVIKVQSFPGDYYENQFLLLSKLRQVTALLSMLASLQPSKDEQNKRLLSSSKLNNFQTLDIKHYMVFYNRWKWRKELDGDCVPMHLNAPSLTEISDLGIELDPGFWNRRPAMSSRINRALKTVHAGYLKHSYGAQRETSAGRLYRKLFRSLAYFRRSFQKSDDSWASIIGLAIAFEMLLTDNYANQVAPRIIRRTRLLLKGTPSVRKYTESVGALYKARGGVVHSGSTDIDVDIQLARRAFVQAYVTVVERLTRFVATSTTPMKDITGDNKE